MIAPRGQINALIDTLPERRAIRPQSTLDDDPRVASHSGSLMWQADKSTPDRHYEEGFGLGAAEAKALDSVDRFARGRRARQATAHL